MLLRSCLKLSKHRFSSYSSHMYKLWKQNPLKVHDSWQKYFQISTNNITEDKPQLPKQSLDKSIQKQKDLALSAYLLIRYYKTNGHQIAEIDPLRLEDFAEFGKVKAKHKLQAMLDNNKVINPQDFDIPFQLPRQQFITDNIATFLQQKTQWTLRQIKSRLQSIYSSKLGVEFMHISCHEEKSWLMKQIEKIPQTTFTPQYKRNILKELTKIQAFNSFLFNKIKTSKRFGVEGLDAMISGLNQLVQEAVQKGIQFVGFGMAHRGRVNTLANVFHKPLERIFAQYQENMINEASWGKSGDVNYHLGSAITRQINDKKIRLSILPNPSHLQTVNPVAMGHVKAYQDATGCKSLCVIVHGDAAISGQGVTYQSLQMSYLPHYSSKGVIHVIANNQIGFTTTPAQARTGLYCTDIAKTIQAPVFHVNADQPQLVHKVMHLALEYRERYNKDVFVDVVGYRRYGHNQLDQPNFTQPMMYRKIGQREKVYESYQRRLVGEGVISEGDVKELWEKQMARLQSAYTTALKQDFDVKQLQFQNYHKFPTITTLSPHHKTGITLSSLKEIGYKLTQIPQHFNIHPQIKKVYDLRRQSIQQGKGIDYGTGEALAFASLIEQGYNVRVSGQDVERGTFSHRHAVLVDQKSENKFIPLHNLLSEQQRHRVQIQNSPLNEYACLGYEFGYSLTQPNTLTIWQAQFGDFANGAQIIIDDYMASGQNKWNIQSGVVLNLPHGMDGQGPEHSSCRIQRFLQLVNDGWTRVKREEVLSVEGYYNQLTQANIHVVCCSTAANLFHLYRRQVRRSFRKPLINVVNKKLLKNKQSSSTLQQLAQNHFLTVIDDDTITQKKQVSKLVITYGQAYYAARQRRDQLNLSSTVAIVRIQQLAPLDYNSLKKINQQYENVQKVVWFQQEHRNAGPWGYLGPRIGLVLQWLKQEGRLREIPLSVCSRKVSAATAVGNRKRHDQQQEEILAQLFK